MGSLFLSLILIIRFLEDPLRPPVTILQLFQNCSKSPLTTPPPNWTFRLHIFDRLFKMCVRGASLSQVFLECLSWQYHHTQLHTQVLVQREILDPYSHQTYPPLPAFNLGCPSHGFCLIHSMCWVRYTPHQEFDTVCNKSLKPLQSVRKPPASKYACIMHSPSRFSGLLGAGK